MNYLTVTGVCLESVEWDYGTRRIVVCCQHATSELVNTDKNRAPIEDG